MVQNFERKIFVTLREVVAAYGGIVVEMFKTRPAKCLAEVPDSPSNNIVHNIGRIIQSTPPHEFVKFPYG